MLGPILLIKGYNIIDAELTKEQYAYRPEDLSVGSSKNVYVRCDYCSDYTTKVYKAYG